MTEKLVKASVAVAVREAVESSVRPLSVERPAKRSLLGAAKKDDYKGIVEAVLQGVATRIVLTHSFKDLGTTLSDTLTTIRAGGMDAAKLDMLKGRVLDTANKIKGGREGAEISARLQEHFKLGQYEEAAAWLKTIAESPDFGLPDQEKNESVAILQTVKKENHTSADELRELASKRDELRQANTTKKTEIVKRADEIQMEVGREEFKVMTDNVEPEEVETKRTITEAKRTAVNDEVRAAPTIDKADERFIKDVLLGASGSNDRNFDFAGMDRKLVDHMWHRTAGILGSRDWSGEPQTEQLLREINKSARRVLLDNATQNMVMDVMSPERARWLALPQEEQELITRNLNFIDKTHGDFREVMKMADAYPDEDYAKHGRERDRLSRTDGAMLQLKQEYAANRPDFDLENKLIYNEATGRWTWNGTKEDFFDVCREEVYRIQGQLTQDNMSNLIFEESAQQYLALMRIDVGNDLELEAVKDAITKTLYIDFAVKTMWRAGGNIEGWQRAANVLTQDNKRNFFQLMGMGEMLKAENAEGRAIDIGRASWEDLMTVAEMKASNGQYFLTFMSGQSTDLMDMRKPEFMAALSKVVVERQLRKEKLSPADARMRLEAIDRGELKFVPRQARSMVDYMQFLEVATFRGGEFGLNDSIIPGKFNLTSLPCGEVVQKTGPWSIIYDWFYPVTKYGGEWVGKLFLPNVNILSYRRGETLAHFIAKDSKVAAGMLDKTGHYHETGTGAKEFFFGGQNRDAVDAAGRVVRGKKYSKNGYGDLEDDPKNTEAITEIDEFNQFWGSVIFDVRTGGAFNKTAINRTVTAIRQVGAKKLADWEAAGRMGFVEHMDFTRFEAMIGYRVPGATKKDQFKWMVENFDYSFWRRDTLPSKAVGDWVGKYVPKKYEDARLKLAAFLNAPGTATLGAVRDIISEYSDESTFNEMAQWVLKDNRRGTLSRRMVDKNGREQGTLGYDATSGRKKWVGFKHADRNLSKWVSAEGEEGDNWTVTELWHSATEGYHLGSGIATSRQQGKELFRDPMYFEKMEIDNQFHAGMLTREEWGELKREFQMKAYFGEAIEIKGKQFRLGYIPVLTPFFLFRGWWVDRMHLDFEDFMIALRKNNEATWEKLKKIIGM